MRIRVLGAAMLVVAGGALADPPQGQPAEQAAQQAVQPEAQPEKKVCRTERATGSLTRRNRICLTETQWREIYDRTRTGHDDFIRSASGGCMAADRGGSMCGG